MKTFTSYPHTHSPRGGGSPVRRAVGLLSAAMLGLGLVACGEGSPSGQDVDTTATEEEGGLEQVTVGAIAIADVAPLHLAVQEGFFEEEGLNVEIVETTGGAVSLPGVVADDFDFAFLNVVSLMIARDQGIDVQFVANGTTTTGEPGEDNIGIVSGPESALEDTDDLTGSESTSNQLNNIGDVATRLAVDNAGGDGGDVEFIELAFGEAQASVENGNVESALLAEPYLTQALDAGLKQISTPYAEAHPQLDTGGYFTTAETIEGSSETVEKFQRAINRSLEYSQENPEQVRDVISTYTTIDEQLLERITLPRFTPDFTREGLEQLGDSAVEHGYLEDAPNLDEMLPAA